VAEAVIGGRPQLEALPMNKAASLIEEPLHD
jgi:hypothetical protein